MNLFSLLILPTIGSFFLAFAIRYIFIEEKPRENENIVFANFAISLLFFCLNFIQIIAYATKDLYDLPTLLGYVGGFSILLTLLILIVLWLHANKIDEWP